MRKSPFKHEVHTHNRVTPKTKRKVKIKTYKRGEGKEPTSQIFKHKQPDKSHGGFDIKILYTNGKTDKNVVVGSDYREAVPKGIDKGEQQVRSITLRKMEPWTREVSRN